MADATAPYDAVVTVRIDEILEIERRLLAAWGSPDETIEDLVDEGFAFWSFSGERWDRTKWLEIMAAGA